MKSHFIWRPAPRDERGRDRWPWRGLPSPVGTLTRTIVGTGRGWRPKEVSRSVLALWVAKRIPPTVRATSLLIRATRSFFKASETLRTLLRKRLLTELCETSQNIYLLINIYLKKVAKNKIEKWEKMIFKCSM